MRRRTVVSLAAACLMAACAHQTTVTQAPDMAWSLQSNETEGVKLAFGAPQSDNVFLMLMCQPRSGEVLVSVASAGDGQARSTVELQSGAARSALAGEFAPSGGDGGFLTEARAMVDNPALAAFAKGGPLAVVESGRRAALPVTAADRPQITGFFEACRAA